MCVRQYSEKSNEGLCARMNFEVVFVKCVHYDKLCKNKKSPCSLFVEVVRDKFRALYHFCNANVLGETSTRQAAASLVILMPDF